MTAVSKLIINFLGERPFSENCIPSDSLTLGVRKKKEDKDDLTCTVLEQAHPLWADGKSLS